ncbi:hypothetical protein [Chelativorans sp. J32]|uniref:hypothetical protein n=1 Tax=Chelativorans sp. J32 TaxID=935840 RepID=UPI00047F8BC5|nr:hypothetical protein [Chelativorans sp. J32]
MKIAVRIREFFAIGLAAPCLIPLLLVSGCAGTASQAGSRTQPDGYPNLNVPIEAAAPQITEEERVRMTGELSAKRQRPQGGQASSAEVERMRSLAQQRQQQTLKQIETSADQ